MKVSFWIEPCSVVVQLDYKEHVIKETWVHTGMDAYITEHDCIITQLINFLSAGNLEKKKVLSDVNLMYERKHDDSAPLIDKHNWASVPNMKKEYREDVDTLLRALELLESINTGNILDKFFSADNNDGEGDLEIVAREMCFECES